MSYFCDSIKYEKYIINETYMNDYKGAVILPLIEIFNKDKVDFDFSNVVISCTDEKLKNVEISKILIDYGDGYSEILNESLVSKNSSIGDFIKNKWQETSHTFITPKKHVYKGIEKVTSYPHISITFLNHFNDKFYFIIPYKILYKSYYEEGSDISLMDANIGNNNVTSFTIRERRSNNIIILSSKSFSEEIEVFSDPVTHIKSSDDYYVDDEDMVWNWSIYPELDITQSDVSFNVEKNNYDITLDWKEKKVNLYKFKLNRRKMGTNEAPKTICDDFTIHPFKDNVEAGIYHYTFDITGINDLSNTQDLYLKCQYHYPATICVPSYTNVVNSHINEKIFEISFSFKESKQTPTSFEMFKKFNIILTNEENLLVFIYDVLKEEIKEHQGTYSFKVLTDVLPNGNYTITMDVEDVCGGTSKSFLSNDGINLINPNTSINYIIGEFEQVKINNDNFIPGKDISINDEIIKFEWDFVEIGSKKEAGNVDFFEIELEKLENV